MQLDAVIVNSTDTSRISIDVHAIAVFVLHEQQQLV